MNDFHTGMYIHTFYIVVQHLMSKHRIFALKFLIEELKVHTIFQNIAIIASNLNNKQSMVWHCFVTSTMWL
jgi:hypothetical protein